MSDPLSTVAKEYGSEVASVLRDILRTFDSTKQEFTRFLLEIDKNEQFTRITDPASDLRRGAIIREKDSPKNLLVSLSSSQPITVRGKKKFVFFSLTDYYLYGGASSDPDEIYDSIVELRPTPEGKMEDMGTFELMELRADDIGSLRRYIERASKESPSEKKVEKKVEKKMEKKEKPATKKKTSSVTDVIDLGALLGEEKPEKEEPKAEKPKEDEGIQIFDAKKKEKRERIRKTVEEISKEKEAVEKAAKEIKSELRKERENRIKEEIDKIMGDLKDIAAREIHKMGYSTVQSVNIVSSLEPEIEKLALNVANKIMNLNAAVRILTENIIKNRVPKPSPIDIGEGRGITKKETPRYFNPQHLLEMACLWVMSSYGQDTERAYALCKERKGDIERLSKKMLSGDMSLIDAVKELENLIVKSGKLTRVIEAYKEPTGEEAQEAILFSDAKRMKLASKAKERLVAGALVESGSAGKNILHKASLDVKEALRKSVEERIEADQKLKGALQTSTSEVYVHLKRESAMILEFQCYKATGLSREECFKQLVGKIASEYGLTLVNAPNGWHAHFGARTREDGKIEMIHGGRVIHNFWGMIEEMKEKYEKPRLVLVYVDSYIDKREYDRII